MATFRELFQASIKSADTEEWVDAHFNHPIGLLFALFWNKLNIHPLFLPWSRCRMDVQLYHLAA